MKRYKLLVRGWNYAGTLVPDGYHDSGYSRAEVAQRALQHASLGGDVEVVPMAA